MTTGARATETDLEIVLAVDASGSVDGQEFRLQLGGVAAALRDPSVQAAIMSGPSGRIAVSLMVWSDSAFPKFATDWVVLDSPQSAANFATVVWQRDIAAPGQAHGDGAGRAGQWPGDHH